MARKILLVYAVYTIIVFLINTYFFKEDYTDALLKAVLSGVVFTAIYAIITMRNEKRQEEEKEKNVPQKKKR
jgi:galactitol-specific phosphotransferase system IIC component